MCKAMGSIPSTSEINLFQFPYSLTNMRYQSFEFVLINSHPIGEVGISTLKLWELPNKTPDTWTGETDSSY
jgi:hypothetical protein